MADKIRIGVSACLLGQQFRPDEKLEMLEIFDRYRNEFVPVTLLNHFVRKYDAPYLKQQVYLNPHHITLKLRHHA